jgi:hypothetical protein
MRLVYERYSKEVAALSTEIAKCDKEIKALEKRKNQLLEKFREDGRAVTQLQHKLQQWEKNCKEAGKLVTALIKQFPWIEAEKHNFGVSGTDYDFDKTDVKASKQRLAVLKSEQVRKSISYVL